MRLPVDGIDKVLCRNKPMYGCVPRLTFPALQQNTSPTAVLSTFIAVLGKKIDNADIVKDCQAVVKLFPGLACISHVQHGSNRFHIDLMYMHVYYI